MTVSGQIEKLKCMPPNALALVHAEEIDFMLELMGSLELSRKTMTRQFMDGYPPETLDCHHECGDYVPLSDWDSHCSSEVMSG